MSEHQNRSARLRQIVDSMPDQLRSSILLLYDRKGDLTVIHCNQKASVSIAAWARDAWAQIGTECEDNVHIAFCDGDLESIF